MTPPLPSDPATRDVARLAQSQIEEITIKSFFNGGGSDEDSSILKELRRHVLDERKANVYYGLALDKAMQAGIGLQTSMFLPHAVLAPLQPGERRFKDVVECEGAEPQTRSCIENTSSGAVRVEYPAIIKNGIEWEPTLYTAIDRCSVGKPLAEFLTYGLHMRYLNQCDVWHILEGFIKKTYPRVGKYFKKQEALVAYRCFKGPYNSQSFWGQLRGSGIYFFAHFGPANEYYDVCFPIICQDRGVSMENRTAPGFKEWMWSTFPTCKFLTALNFIPAAGRWGEFEEKHQLSREDRGVILMILLKVGVDKGWWPSIDKSPMKHLLNDLVPDELLASLAPIDPDLGASDAAPIVAAASSSSAPHKKMSVADANREVDAIRQTKANTLDFTTWYYAQREELEELDAQVEVISPLREFMREWMTIHRTLRGSREFFLGLSDGLLDKVVVDTWSKLATPSVLQKLGLSSLCPLKVPILASGTSVKL